MDEKKKSEYTTISIPGSLAAKIEARLKEAGFETVSAYVTYVLKEVVGEDEPADVELEKEEAFSEEEEEMVKKRLQALGYLD